MIGLAAAIRQPPGRRHKCCHAFGEFAAGRVFAAAAAFLVSITVVSTAVFGLGHFGDASLSLADRAVQAQVAILFVALGA